MPIDHYDVVIAGGAVTGSSAAYFLTADPAFRGTVAIVEQDTTFQHCATTLSAASIRHQFSTPENMQMSLFGTQFLREAADLLEVNGQRPDPGFHERGYLFLATPEGAASLRANHAVQTKLGANIALLDRDALAARYPWMNTSDLEAGALGLSGEGWFDAYGFMQGLRHKALAQGAVSIAHKVVDVRREGRHVTGVVLDNGQVLSCGALINAAGIGAPALARKAGIELPVQARKRSVFFFHAPVELPGCPMVIDATGAYFRPEGQGFISGINPPPGQDHECDDYDVQHELFDELLWPILAGRVPAFEALRVMRSWAGHYDMNVLDQNVILGLHPDVDNFYFANGFSGHGLQQSPAVGRALSELIVHGGYRSLDLRRLGWQRILDNKPLVEHNIW